MPIYEFRCLQCGQLFEKLFRNPEEQIQFACPHCLSPSFDRVISRTNHIIGTAKSKPQLISKSCGSGNSCKTIELPGHER